MTLDERNELAAIRSTGWGGYPDTPIAMEWPVIRDGGWAVRLMTRTRAEWEARCAELEELERKERER